MALASMNIALNQALMDFVAADMRENGYATISEYVRALVRERRRQHEHEQLIALAQEVRSHRRKATASAKPPAKAVRTGARKLGRKRKQA